MRRTVDLKAQKTTGTSIESRQDEFKFRKYATTMRLMRFSMLIDTRRIKRVTTEYCRLQECITVGSEERGVADMFWQGVNEVATLPKG